MLKSNWIISPEIGMKIPKIFEVSPPSMTTKKTFQLQGSILLQTVQWKIFGRFTAYGLRPVQGWVVCRWCDVNIVIMWVDMYMFIYIVMVIPIRIVWVSWDLKYIAVAPHCCRKW